MENNYLSHLGPEGEARMVDISDKNTTHRRAVARGEVVMKKQTLALIKEGQIKKGDVLTVAQIAGITAAKKTAELIPLCHPLPLSAVNVGLTIDPDLPGVQIEAEVKTSGRTGVEMEALTAVSLAALTIYDMAKSAEKGITIQNIRLTEKSGGKSGEYQEENGRTE